MRRHGVTVRRGRSTLAHPTGPTGPEWSEPAGPVLPGTDRATGPPKGGALVEARSQVPARAARPDRVGPVTGTPRKRGLSILDLHDLYRDFTHGGPRRAQRRKTHAPERRAPEAIGQLELEGAGPGRAEEGGRGE